MVAIYNHDLNRYWNDVFADLACVPHPDPWCNIDPLPIRSNEVSDAYAVRFSSMDGYPLFAYLHIPKSDGPHIPLFQAPGYGSVVAVPAYERRAQYAVLALCHRGQRLSNSEYQASYPGLLTDGLLSPDGDYVWQRIVLDCLRAVELLVQQENLDATRLAMSGGDLAWITAALWDASDYLDEETLEFVKTDVLQTGGFIFADLENRMTGEPDYPVREFNDYKRTYPGKWDEAKELLANYDPKVLAKNINTRKVMISCGPGEEQYVRELASALSGETTVRVNLGKGHLDHIAQEEWLANACGIEPGPVHYPRA